MCPLEYSPEEVECEINGNSDIVGDEPLVIEAACDRVEAVEEDDEGEEPESNPGEIRLERRCELHIGAVDTLCLASGVEPDVSNADADPGEEGGDGRQVLEPLEDCGGARRGRHVCQKTERACDEYTPHRNTRLGAFKQKPGCLSILCDGVKVSRAKIQEGIG